VLALATAVVAFSPPPHRSTAVRKKQTKLLAIGVLARKAKENAAKKLRESLTEDSPVGALLAQAERGTLRRQAPTQLFERLTQSKALQVIAEYHRKTLSTLRANNVAEYEIPPLTLVSAEVRAAGAIALGLNVDAATGGCTYEDVAAAVAEQAVATGDYPGPLPVIWSDTVVSEVQLGEAAANGAQAITISVEALELEKLLEQAAETYGLEAFVSLSKSEDESEDAYLRKLEALPASAKLVLLTGLGDPHVDLCRRAKALLRDERALIVRVDALDDQGLEEAELAWRFRDVGVDAVWVSDVLFKFGAFSGMLFSSAPDSITSVVKAMRSKASATFARASGSFSGKGEGAREYLGDILM